ncbi:MAG: anaerobic sulfite reductase subunit AsrB [Cellulosilyticaceae bacterium]
MNPYASKPYKVLQIYPQTAIDLTYIIEHDMDFKPGQFVEVSIPRVGEAPISISDFDEKTLEMTIRKVGKLTDEVYYLKPGEHLFMRGPYGNGFEMDYYKNKHLVIVVGGSGIVPVKQLINYFAKNPSETKSFTLIAGFKSPQDIIFKEEIETWQKQIGKMIVSIDRAMEGWNSHVGLVTQYLPDLDYSQKEDTEYIVVGPPMMMKFTCNELERLGVSPEKITVSFERKMSCAIGKCGHCKINETYVCVEGPIFNYTKAKELLD